MKKTRWIDGTSRPELPGIYERNYKHEKARVIDRHVGVAFCHWNGCTWGMFGRTPGEAMIFQDHVSINQCIPWRGLASDPCKG